MSKKPKFPDKSIFVCLGSKCKKHGSKEYAKSLKKMFKSKKNSIRMEVFKTECTGRCKFAPVLCIQPENEWHIQYDYEVLGTLFED